MTTTPNMVIFRLMDCDDGTKRFAALDYRHGKLSNEIQPFTVLEGDPYNELLPNHIVIAEKIEEGSFDILRFIVERDGEPPTPIYQLDFEAVAELADYMVAETKEVLAIRESSEV